MSKKFYPFFLLFLLFAAGASAQLCTNFTASAVTLESRCAATGKIIITAANGSGTYNYSVTGPVSTPYTSNDTIDGLPAGVYQVFVKDVVDGCFYTIPSVIVGGSYHDPRFDLLRTNVTCINGTDGTITVDNVQFGRPPFSYTIVAPSTYGIGTTNSTGVFTDLVAGSYFIQQRDSCGGIQTRNISVLNYDWFIDQSSVTKFDCDSADIFIKLKDIFGNVNTSGNTFDGFTYGAITPDGDTISFNTNNFQILLGNFRTLKLFAKDKCGNIKTVNWSDNKKPTLASAVTQFNKECTFFSVRVTGQQNLTDPNYCLYDSLDNLITCNTSGQFDSLAYGSYCIKMTDVCFDTVITRCFTAVKPVPNVAANVTVTNGDDCQHFNISVSGQTNLFNPQFCLYDSLNVLIGCNNSGDFDNLPVGNYCMQITGSICNDTTILRCFTIAPVELGPGVNVAFSNYSCGSFTGTLTGGSGLGNAHYCLYDNLNVLIGCNYTGVFDSLAFGSYCMTIETSVLTGACADTLFTRCFTVTKPTPSVSNVVTDKTCNFFKATIPGTQNMLNPNFCLYQNNVLINCNTTGVFDSLAFGNYCIRVTDSCADTTIEKCFEVLVDVIDISVKAKASCSLDETKITVNVETGTGPFEIKVFDPSGNLIKTINTNNTQFVIDSLSNLPTGDRYTITVSDGCGNLATTTIAPVVSYFTKSSLITRNCPGGSFTQGSSDIQLTLNSNLAKVFPTIIKKNGVTVNTSYSFSNSSQTVFTFKDLEPGTYIIRSRVNNSCNLTLYDTITVTAYQYPSLQNSTLYRCDDNSFNISAVTTGGITPAMYEIIGSIPNSPSIIAPPQASPVFNINNGTAYTLVRLRVLDACGNASINDISTVPLVNVVINVEGGCIFDTANLKVEPVPGATYSWYKKTSAVDSILVGNASNYYIPYITLADTAMYVCKVELQSGCITRLAYYRITGYCDQVLDDSNIKLQGKKLGNNVLISWKVNSESDLKEYVLERKRSDENQYTAIHQEKVKGSNGLYSFTDTKPGYSKTYYRIRVVKQNGNTVYTNYITIRNDLAENGFNTYPNPVKEVLTVQLNNTSLKEIVWKLFDINGRLIQEKRMSVLPQQNFQLLRPSAVKPGMYLLSITDLQSNTTVIKKIMFQ